MNQSEEAIEKVNAANPDAVVIVRPSNTVAPILKQSHAKGSKPLFATVFVGTDELVQEAGADAEGMVITQVVPPYCLTDQKDNCTVSPHAGKSSRRVQDRIS